MIEIQFNATPVKERLAALREAIGVRNVSEVLRLRFRAWLDESFAESGAHPEFGVQRWKPLAWTTVAMRERGGDRPLQDTGELMKSWQATTDGRTHVRMGTEKTPLAEWHEHGTRPYIIRVKNAKVLAGKFGKAAGAMFIISGPGKGGQSGYLFFGKEVHHPGIPARAVLPTMGVARAVVQKTMDAMLANLKLDS